MNNFFRISLIFIILFFQKADAYSPIILNHGDNNSVTASCFSSDGTKFISASVDKKIRIWEVATGKILQTKDSYQRIEHLYSIHNNSFFVTIPCCGNIPNVCQTMSVLDLTGMVHSDILAGPDAFCSIKENKDNILANQYGEIYYPFDECVRQKSEGESCVRSFKTMLNDLTIEIERQQRQTGKGDNVSVWRTAPEFLQPYLIGERFYPGNQIVSVFVSANGRFVGLRFLYVNKIVLGDLHSRLFLDISSLVRSIDKVEFSADDQWCAISSAHDSRIELWHIPTLIREREQGRELAWLARLARRTNWQRTLRTPEGMHMVDVGPQQLTRRSKRGGLGKGGKIPRKKGSRIVAGGVRKRTRDKRKQLSINAIEGMLRKVSLEERTEDAFYDAGVSDGCPNIIPQ